VCPYLMISSQINGVPHQGMNLVQAAALLLAKIARRTFFIDTSSQMRHARLAALHVSALRITEDQHRRVVCTTATDPAER
jgi:hypothetical protein